MANVTLELFPESPAKNILLVGVILGVLGFVNFSMVGFNWINSFFGIIGAFLISKGYVNLKREFNVKYKTDLYSKIS